MINTHTRPLSTRFSKSVLAVLLAALSLCMWLHASTAQAQSPAANQEKDFSTYELGAGDVISVSVFGEEDLSLDSHRISDAGTLYYPILGEIKTLHKTVGALERQITDGLKGRYLVNPKVTVRIVEYRPFYINGKVEKPGAYPYQPGMTVRTAAALAGGFKETASLGTISVLREQGNAKATEGVELDAKIGPGDTIVVPEYLPIYVNGMVEKAGAYPYQPGLTVRHAAALAGGFKERASMSKIYVIRANDPAQKPVKCDLNTTIQPGDTIVVEDSFF